MRDGEIEALIDTMIARKVWYEPTRLVTYYWNHLGDYDRAALSPHHRWTQDVKAGTTPAAPSALSLGIEAAEARFIRRFHDAGGVIVAGTDDIPFAPYGVSEELRLLVLAGLSPLAAIQASTINAAQVLGWSDAGAIEAGKVADLVVLDADPLQDILNVRKIRAVVLEGRLIDRRALDEFLARVR
jgi:imidazolonepropionase-like amidohydrolase